MNAGIYDKKESEVIDMGLFTDGFILMVESKKELESVCETVETIGKRNSCTIDTHYLKQREAGISEKLSDNFIIFEKNNYYYDL